MDHYGFEARQFDLVTGRFGLLQTPVGASPAPPPAPSATPAPPAPVKPPDYGFFHPGVRAAGRFRLGTVSSGDAFVADFPEEARDTLSNDVAFSNNTYSCAPKRGITGAQIGLNNKSYWSGSFRFIQELGVSYDYKDLECQEPKDFGNANAQQHDITGTGGIGIGFENIHEEILGFALVVTGHFGRAILQTDRRGYDPVQGTVFNGDITDRDGRLSPHNVGGKRVVTGGFDLELRLQLKGIVDLYAGVARRWTGDFADYLLDAGHYTVDVPNSTTIYGGVGFRFGVQ